MPNDKPPSSAGRTAAWGLLAFAYAVAFAQRVAPQTLVDALRADFAATVAQIGLLASGYFYGYMLMQLPAGVLVDGLGVRKAVIVSLAASAAGTAVFAAAPSLTVAFHARVAIACSDAIVFAALLKYVAQNFEDRRFGLVSSLSQVCGYVGGIVATFPLAVVVAAWGWRPSFWTVAAVLAANAALVALVVPRRGGILGDGSGGALQALRTAFLRMRSFLGSRAAWASSLCFASYFVAGMSLSGVWGFEILVTAFGVSREEAAGTMSLVLLSTMVGVLAGGYLADRLLHALRAALVGCAALRTLCLCALAPAIGLTLGARAVEAALVAFGLFGGVTLPLVFRTIKQIYGDAYIGTGTAINSSVAGIVTALVQPLVGALLDRANQPAAAASSSGYDLVAALFVLASAVGILAPLALARPAASLVRPAAA